MDTLNGSTLSTFLRNYASQLHEIQLSISKVAMDAGQHRETLFGVAFAVGSASSIARSASTVICSVELRNQHIARVKAAAQGQ